MRCTTCQCLRCPSSMPMIGPLLSQPPHLWSRQRVSSFLFSFLSLVSTCRAYTACVVVLCLGVDSHAIDDLSITLTVSPETVILTGGSAEEDCEL